MSTPSDVPRFSTVRMREGYDISEVDEFLAQVSAALTYDPPLMRAEDVEAKRFRPVRMHAGYDMTEVDDHLDHVADELRRRQPDEPPQPDVLPPAARSAMPVWPVVLVLLAVVLVVVAAIVLGL